MAKARKPREDRFWSFSIPEPNSGCWLWTGGVCGNGYGGFNLVRPRKSISASRFAFELTHGSIPDGLHVLHRCDNKLCVNPEHLYAGTRSQNMQDAYDRGRQPFRSGVLRHNAKLTDEIVREIRRSDKMGAEWARELGVSSVVIYNIRNGKTWRHVSG